MKLIIITVSLSILLILIISFIIILKPVKKRKNIIPLDTFNNDYRFLISAQCKPYQDWQASTAYYSIKKVWPEAGVTRTLACDDPQNYLYLEIMPTFTTQDYTYLDGEEYLPFNRPGSLIEYFEYNDPQEKYLIIMDPDMILLKKIDLIPLPGNPIGQFYDHMFYGQAPGKPNTGEGLKKIAQILLPEKQNQIQAVGAPIIICKQDLKKIAPLWLYYTRLIRSHPECKIIASWIAEMHGYALACAHLDIQHTLMDNLADRTPYNEKDPYMLHYDLPHTGIKEEWNKRHYMYDLFDDKILMQIPKSGNTNFKKVFEEINYGIEKTRDSLFSE